MISQDIFVEKKEEKKEILLATVMAVYNNGLLIKIDGDSEQSNKIYKCNKSITFRKGDRVKIVPYSGTYIVEYPIN